MRLLIIEDEKDIADPLKIGLEKQGYAVDIENDGKSGFQSALINEYDCILLDLNLPGKDGLSLARELRNKNIFTPILMLTARSQQVDKIKGFEAGTDDYLTKPFHFKELLLRINSLIKRNSRTQTNKINFNSLEIDLDAKKIKYKNKNITLNQKEFGILEYLIRNKGKAISQEELLEHVWDNEIDPFTDTVKTNIKTLRKKIDPEKNLIKTIRGAGYIIGESNE